MNGYGGKILLVNLTNEAILIDYLKPEEAQEWIGGRGFAAYFLYHSVTRGTSPLSPENAVVMASGPLSGTLVPGGGKVHFATKSPATGGYGDSNMGGHIAAEMKYAGFDAIIITGKSRKPCYLFIQDDQIEIRKAEYLWGKGAIETEKILKQDLGEEFQIAVIGPAGEKQVYFACISHDFGRQAGRTGVGAVLGSKNLKAIAIRGTKAIPIADIEGMTAKGKEILDWCSDNQTCKLWQRYGTTSLVDWANRAGAFPTRNFQSEFFEDHEKINAETMRETIVLHNKACFACPMCCGKYSRASSPKYDICVEGPEYETIAMCGGNCGINSIKDIAYANWLCDELGLDTISGGNVIAFAIECLEKGIITKEQTEGKELRFGDIESFEYLARKIAARDGFLGNLLANGVKEASKKLGKGSEEFAIQVKGLEWSGYGSRYAPAMALAYMTCDVGAHHNRAWAITHDIEKGRDKIEGKAERVIFLQHVRPMFDMLGVCRLLWVELELDLQNYPQLLKTVTGLDYTLDDLLKISEKVWNLTRAFSVREIEGFGRAFDQPPARFLKEAVPAGPARGKKLSQKKVNRLLNDYYKLRGWTKSGLPTEEKLRELGLEFLIKDIHPQKGQ